MRKFAAATPKLSAGLKGVNQELKAEPSSVNQQENYERHHSPNFSPNSSWVSSGFFSFLPTPKNRLPTSHTNIPGIGGKKNHNIERYDYNIVRNDRNIKA